MDQGTIKHFDEGERTGSLLTDDRTEVAIDPGSLEGSGVLTLRIGQRVRFETERFLECLASTEAQRRFTEFTTRPARETGS